LESATRERVPENLRKNRRGVSFYTSGGVKHCAAYEPVGVNNWFLFRSRPPLAAPPHPRRRPGGSQTPTGKKQCP